MAGKPMLGIAIGVGKPKPGAGASMPDDEMGMADEEEGGDVVAARGLMDAVKSGDPQAVVDSFRTLLEFIDADAEEPEEDEPTADSMMEA